MEKHIIIIEEENGYVKMIQDLINCGWSKDQLTIYTSDEDVVTFPRDMKPFCKVRTDVVQTLADPNAGRVIIIQTDQIHSSTLKIMMENVLPESRRIVDVMTSEHYSNYAQEMSSDPITYLFYTESTVQAILREFLTRMAV